MDFYPPAEEKANDYVYLSAFPHRKGCFFEQRKKFYGGEIMPSAKVLEEKKAQVLQLTDRIKNSCTGILVSYQGINVADDTKLRKDLREAGVEYTVVKNSLLSRAFEQVELSDLGSTLAGTTAIATSVDDYSAAARILCGYAKKNSTFEVKGGYLDGAVMDMATIDSISKLPTREVLLANVLGAFQAPIASFARAIQAIVDKGGVDACEPVEKEETEEAAPEEAPAEEVKEETSEADATEAPAEESKE